MAEAAPRGVFALQGDLLLSGSEGPPAARSLVLRWEQWKVASPLPFSVEALADP